MPMHYADMITLLQGRGVDIKNFDRNSRKTLRQLHKEIEDRDVVLAYDKKLRRVVRTALSVKILITAEEYLLLEIRRQYADGSVIERLRDWSISETRKRGELVFDAAVRGLWEECELRIHTDKLTLGVVSDEINTHESSVYAGLLSHSIIQRVGLDLPERPWEGDDKVIDDNGVKIHLRWFALA